MAQGRTPGLTKRGDTWHYDILIDGERYRGSTKTSDLKTATLFVNQLRLDVARGKLALAGTQKTVLLEDIFMEFMTAKKISASPLYITSMTAHWLVWLQDRLGKMSIEKIHPTHVDELRNALLGAGRSKVFTNNVLTTLRTLLNFAVKRGKMRKKGFTVELLRVQKKPRPTVPAEKVQEFLGVIDSIAANPQVRVMIRTMLGLGCRPSEVLGMRWEWLDIQGQTYTVGKAKGKEARVLPVPTWLMGALLSMPKPLISEWVFPARNGKPHCPGFLRKPLMAAAEKLKLGNVTQHRLRATFASLHAEAGTPVTEIQGMLGHKNIATTMIYVETSLDAKRRAQDALSLKLGLVSGGLQ
ncbi:MAG: integrase [Holophagaceae bacterium]|nr:integrase [Holophagaceae bacterium]